MFSKLKNSIYDLLFPPYCISCTQVGSFLCPKCSKEIVRLSVQYCPFCRKPIRNGQTCPDCKEGHHLTGCVAYGYYKNPILKEVIHNFKYEGVTSLSDILAPYLCGLVREEKIKFDIVVAVPITIKRLNDRGYNQAEILARKVAQELKETYFEGLKKQKETKPQVGLKRRERISNLRGAFLVEGSVKAKRILLIDDVLTTGSTLDECARVLKKAGAKEVYGLVLARE
ncbi:MAG: ComF family protein [Patescibacteria group bacterium]|nr:ComF family protein [Patescibacteria group bacterium]